MPISLRFAGDVLFVVGLLLETASRFNVVYSTDVMSRTGVLYRSILVTLNVMFFLEIAPNAVANIDTIVYNNGTIVTTTQQPSEGEVNEVWLRWVYVVNSFVVLGTTGHALRHIDTWVSCGVVERVVCVCYSHAHTHRHSAVKEFCCCY